MNFKNNPRHIMRIVALALSIILVFSGITVFYAADGDEGSGSLLSSDGDVVPGEDGNTSDGDAPTTPPVIAPDEDKNTSDGDAPDEDENTSDGDAPDEDGNTSDGDAPDEDGNTSDGDAPGEDGNTSDGDAPGEDEDTSDSDAPDEDENTSDSDVSDSDVKKGTCPWCGGSNYYTAYDEYYDEYYEWCEDKFCHEHYYCPECTVCGGCMDGLYDDSACYDSAGDPCKACNCFAIEQTGDAKEYMTVEQAKAMVDGKGSKDIYLDNYLTFYSRETKGISLSQALAKGAKIKSLTASGAPVNTKAYGKKIDCIVPTSGGAPEPMFTYDNRFVDGAKESTPNVVIKVSLTLEYKGVVKSINFDYVIDFIGESRFKKIEIKEGSENIKLEVGETAKVVYKVTMADEDNEFCCSPFVGNWNVAEVEFEKGADVTEMVATIAGLKKGETAVRLTFADGPIFDQSDEQIVRTIKVEVVEPSAPAALGSVDFEEDIIESGKNAYLEIKGWCDGGEVKKSNECHLPMKWSVGTKGGKWGLPGAGSSDAVMIAMFEQSPAVKGLAVGEHTARVDFQAYERGEDGLWYPVSGGIYVGTAKIKVEAASTGNPGDTNNPGGLEKPDDNNNNNNNNNNGSNNGGSNTGDGKAPGTGEIVRENPGVKTAGIIMLIAGLLIFGTLAAERVYRELQARKRQAEAIRR